VSTPPAAHTTSGPLQGKAGDGGIASFLGVPFAAVPARFAPPAPPERWTETRTADRFGPAPLQVPSGYLPPETEYAEDCLTLNIWTPQTDGRLPVLVWIYGGGFEGGASSAPWLDGTRLAAAGPIVVVSLNYRVGAFGFSYLAHRGGALSHASNLGLQDVIAALGWVRANIEHFGGNPEQVTVAGESAGGFLAAALAAAPRAQGMFHRLGLFSGGASRIVPLSTATEQSDALLHALGAEARPEEIVNAEAQGVLDAQRSVIATDIGLRNGVSPQALGVVLDAGTPHGVLEDHPMSAFASGAAKRIPLLVCSTQHEIAAFRSADPEQFDPKTRTDLEAQAQRWGIPPQEIPSLVEAYSAEGATSGEAKERLLTDWIYRLPAARLAQAHALAGGTAFLAMVPGADGKSAPHACEVTALFGNPSPEKRLAEERRRDAAIFDAFARFATTGEPGWKPATPEAPEARAFGSSELDATAEYASILKTWEGIERP
jgi:para-nitrobenzyl esterase